MKPPHSRGLFRAAVVCAILAMAASHDSRAQSVPYDRAFSQSRTAVLKQIAELRSSSAGHLPVLEGFAVPGDRPLSRYQRGYYECVAQVSSTPSGGSLVRVNATITAWYTDPAAAKSGYQVLASNGRLENDFLDRLQEALGGKASSPVSNPAANSPPPPTRNNAAAREPAISAPMPGDAAPGVKTRTPLAGSPFKLGDPMDAGRIASLATQKAIVDKHAEEQEKEARSLEEILNNQVHPSNLAAVKIAETPVLASPIENAKVLFLASAEDEFEILDSNPNWVHVRISGLSRGWIRRSSLELPTAGTDAPSPDANENDGPQNENHQKAPAAPAASPGQQPFQVENEQIASFPGEWAPLRGKTVRIVSVQKSNGNSGSTGSEAKRAFAKTLFDKEYVDLTKASTTIGGIVIIFDSEDGGMMAATLPALREWKTGTLSEEAFWRRCLFDPPDAFAAAVKP